MRLSANIGFLWPDRPLLSRIDAAAAAGFHAIELHWPYDIPAGEVRAACMRNNLQLLALNTPTGDRPGDFGLAAVPGREEEFRGAMRQAVDYAMAAGAGAVHVMAGCVSPDERERAKLTIIENLRFASQLAGPQGIRLLLEPINHIDRPGYFYDRVEDALEIIEQVGDDRLSLMFDCYHVQVAQGDVTRRLGRHAGRIGHVQIAAAPSRAEPDEGELDYRAVFATLREMDYRGWIGCEYKPRHDTNAGLAWRQRFQAA